MTAARRLGLATTAALVLVALCLGPSPAPAQRRPPPPRTVLWAWHGVQELGTLDPGTEAVAFLARTVTLGPGGARVEPRRERVVVPAAAARIAVVRVERDPGLTPAAVAPRLGELVALLREPATLPGVTGLQLDFDAPRSFRPLYRQLLTRLRAELPAGVSLSITALASWCSGDRWLAGLPVDEVVPMLFAMGRGGRAVHAALAARGSFAEPRCRSALGVSLAELPSALPPTGRLYVFPRGPWSAATLAAARTALAAHGRTPPPLSASPRSWPRAPPSAP